MAVTGCQVLQQHHEKLIQLTRFQTQPSSFQLGDPPLVGASSKSQDPPNISQRSTIPDLHHVWHPHSRCFDMAMMDTAAPAYSDLHAKRAGSQPRLPGHTRVRWLRCIDTTLHYRSIGKVATRPTQERLLAVERRWATQNHVRFHALHLRGTQTPKTNS